MVIFNLYPGGKIIARRLKINEIGIRCEFCGVPLTATTTGFSGHAVGLFDITEKHAACDNCVSKRKKTDNGNPGKCPDHPDQEMVIFRYDRGGRLYYRRVCRKCVFQDASEFIRKRIKEAYPEFYDDV